MENNNLDESNNESKEANNDATFSEQDGSWDSAKLEAVLALMESSTESESESDDALFDIALEKSSDDETSSGEESNILTLVGICQRSKRNCIKSYMSEVVPKYTEEEFRMHFRISRCLYLELSEKFEQSELYSSQRTKRCLPAATYMAAFLWFAGHKGCCFRDLGDRFNISIACLSHIIEMTTMFLSSMSPNVIKWPNDVEKVESSRFFRSKCRFPKAIGCIDGTHIKIDPSKNTKDDYIDRKGNVSICLQAICNEKKKFINVFVGYPGSSHDSWVLRNSPIYSKLTAYCGDYYLLGDSAYPCTEHLVTPYKDNGHLTSAQKYFNVKLSSGRVAIEHSFGILKQRFMQLYHCKLRGPKKLCHFIRACCVLHNLSDENDLEILTEVSESTIEVDEVDERSNVARGNAVRDAISQQL